MDFDKLEQQHRNYKLQKLISFYVAPVFIVISLALVGYFYFTVEAEQTAEIKKAEPLPTPVKKEIVEQPTVQQSVKQESLPQKEVLKPSEKLSIQPDFSFEEKISQPPAKNDEIIETELPKTTPKMILTKKTVDPMERLKENFNETPSFEDAVKIGELYFEQNSYLDAKNWAMKANEIDSSKEDSWVLFAKSAMKLGQMDIALKAIDSYLSNHPSEKLQKMKEDIFR